MVPKNWPDVDLIQRVPAGIKFILSAMKLVVAYSQTFLMSEFAVDKKLIIDSYIVTFLSLVFSWE